MEAQIQQLKPTLYINYLVLGELLKAGDPIFMATKTAKNYSQTYSVARNHRFENNILLCAVSHALYTDLMKYDEEHEYRKLYKDKCSKYGQNIIDLFITKDEDLVKNKLIQGIEFSMDKIFKQDEIIIRVDAYKTGCIFGEKYKETSSILDILKEILQEHFKIISKDITEKTLLFKIQRRRA